MAKISFDQIVVRVMDIFNSPNMYTRERKINIDWVIQAVQELLSWSSKNSVDLSELEKTQKLLGILMEMSELRGEDSEDRFEELFQKLSYFFPKALPIPRDQAI